MIWMAALVFAGAVHWQHPAGILTDRDVADIRAKIAGQDWARRLYENHKQVLDRWVKIPLADLRRVFPKTRGAVYHNFSCPTDRCRLIFDPFHPELFRRPVCGKTFAPNTDAGIYKPGDWYYGTMYDGWVCIFYETVGDVAADLGLAARIDHNAAYRKRAIEILMLYADTTEHLVTEFNKDPEHNRLYTYHREGDSLVLFDLARAYELVREYMTPEQRSRFETVVLKRVLNDIILEPIYKHDNNNVYQWHRTILQTALALQREDLIDWCFGYGAYDPQHQPEHRSIRRILATHFKPDGAYWGLNSGYHLYPVYALCELAVLSRHISQMDPQRFPPAKYDLTDPSNPGQHVIKNALEWFISMAMPDRTILTVGDSTVLRSSLASYSVTAELDWDTPDGNVTLIGDQPASVCAAIHDGAVTLECSGPSNTIPVAAGTPIGPPRR